VMAIFVVVIPVSCHHRFAQRLLENALGRIPLPKGEGGPKGRVPHEKQYRAVPLTRRFAAPSPFGRGICPKHSSPCN
jgi:hypothetical protein